MEKPILYVALALFMLSSCGSMQYALDNASMTNIKLGMTKEEVYKRMHKPNMIVMAQKTPQGVLEVVEYRRTEHNSYTDKAVSRPIWLYFENNELIEWDPGEDWQQDQALTERLLERFRSRHKR